MRNIYIILIAIACLIPSESLAHKKFPVNRNPEVQHYIWLYSVKWRHGFTDMLNRSNRYVPDLKQLLHDRGLPTELAYLPLIESGYNPKAESKRNAVGLWQFIEPTAKTYGLRVDFWVDERLSVRKSTEAASDYLSFLYDRFGSWELALAAYNCGEGRVDRAIKRSGSRDFWKLARYLPKETRNYVPKFYAALLIARDPDRYGIHIGDKEIYEVLTPPPNYEEVLVLLKEEYNINKLRRN